MSPITPLRIQQNVRVFFGDLEEAEGGAAGAASSFFPTDFGDDGDVEDAGEDGLADFESVTDRDDFGRFDRRL